MRMAGAERGSSSRSRHCSKREREREGGWLRASGGYSQRDTMKIDNESERRSFEFHRVSVLWNSRLHLCILYREQVSESEGNEREWERKRNRLAVIVAVDRIGRVIGISLASNLSESRDRSIDAHSMRRNFMQRTTCFVPAIVSRRCKTFPNLAAIDGRNRSTRSRHRG